MSWLMASVYDRMLRLSEAACLSAWRAELLSDVEGDVLEVGAGTGANLPYYGPRVDRLVLSEPDQHMRRRLQAAMRRAGHARAEITDASLGTLPMAASSFDVVVSTLVLCSVPDLPAALADAYRVLRPGGRLVFLEHVAAEENPARLRWQRRMDPLWRRVAGNCHLTRRTEAALIAAGFTIDRIQRESIRKAMPLVRPSIRGVARKSL
jgi:ubiquinone/menaquinone biosynthesis C-methylase UbiE